MNMMYSGDCILHLEHAVNQSCNSSWPYFASEIKRSYIGRTREGVQ